MARPILLQWRSWLNEAPDMRAATSTLLFVFALAALMLPAAPALADRIDGNWCFRDGRSMSIDGLGIDTLTW